MIEHVGLVDGRCDAVRCASCGAAFCPLCLTDCGTNAHRHVAFDCKHRKKHGELYGGAEHFKEVTRRRTEGEIGTFLDALHLTPTMRGQVLEACRVELTHAGLNVDRLQRVRKQEDHRHATAIDRAIAQ
jgi:hypothetical protein